MKFDNNDKAKVGKYQKFILVFDKSCLNLYEFDDY